jgi:hypothetical protein
VVEPLVGALEASAAMLGGDLPEGVVAVHDALGG